MCLKRSDKYLTFATAKSWWQITAEQKQILKNYTFCEGSWVSTPPDRFFVLHPLVVSIKVLVNKKKKKSACCPCVAFDEILFPWRSARFFVYFLSGFQLGRSSRMLSSSLVLCSCLLSSGCCSHLSGAGDARRGHGRTRAPALLPCSILMCHVFVVLARQQDTHHSGPRLSLGALHHSVEAFI